MHLVTSLKLADKSCSLMLEGDGPNVETEDSGRWQGCCLHGALGEAASSEARYPLPFDNTPRRLARSRDLSAMQGEPTELQWLPGEKATLQYVVSLRAKPILKEELCWEILQCAGQRSHAPQCLLPCEAGSGCPRGRAAPSRAR